MSTKSNKSFLDVYSGLKRELGLIFGQELKKFKFGRNQMLIVSYLNRFGALTSSELAEHTQADPASTTRTLQALEKVGWIRKVADTEDQRKTLNELTAKGRKSAGKVHEIREGLEMKIRKNLSAAEYEQVVSLMTKLVEALQNNKSSEQIGDT